MNSHKKDRIRKILGYIFVFGGLGILLTGLFLLIGNRYDLMGWTNALTFTTALLLALLWLTFANNKGAFDIITYGVKAFANAFKKNYEKLDFYEYSQNKDKVAKEYYIGLSITFIIYLIPTVVLLVLSLI